MPLSTYRKFPITPIFLSFTMGLSSSLFFIDFPSNYPNFGINIIK